MSSWGRSFANLVRTGAAVVACIPCGLSPVALADAPHPQTGDTLWYLVRALNCGGAGSYDSVGAEQLAPRDSQIALSPGSCP